MNETITPRLRTDVLMRPFDAYAGDDRFIVGVDDRHFVVSAAVAAVLEESRAHSTLSALAERASVRLGMTVTPELASRVLSEQILAVLFHASEQRAETQCPVRMRKRFLEARLLRPLLALLSRLFSRGAAIAVVVLLGFLEVFVASHASNPVPHTLSGGHIVCAGALTLLGVLVHELGHLAACVRFGATHGGIGVGLYWCMPVLYAEVNGAWMLPRSHRAVVDIGGVYFQCVYLLALEAAYLAFGTRFVLEAIVWSHVLMLHTLNPVLKYDGYWLLTDLAGSPNLHAQIRDSARQTWDAVRRVPQASLPGGKQLALLGAFSGTAVAYFAYVLTVLGSSIGHSAGESQRMWATQHETAFGTWHAAGETALLLVLIVVAISMAGLLARSLQRIGKDSREC